MSPFAWSPTNSNQSMLVLAHAAILIMALQPQRRFLPGWHPVQPQNQSLRSVDPIGVETATRPSLRTVRAIFPHTALQLMVSHRDRIASDRASCIVNNGRVKISREGLALLQKLEDEFRRDFDFSFRYMHTILNEKSRKYISDIYLPFYRSEDAYLRYGREGAVFDQIMPFAVRQTFTLNIARIWRSRGTTVHVVEFDGEAYREACKKSGQDEGSPKALSLYLYMLVSNVKGSAGAV